MNNSDFIKFNKDELSSQPNGYLSLLATITRTGVFTYNYINELGESITIRQLRHPEDVFDPKSLSTLMGIPLTNEHPHEFLTPENSGNRIVGMASDKPKEIYLDDDEKYVQQLVTIFDPDTIEDISSGFKRELSLGYTLDHDDVPGEWNGEQYDVRQRNIRYNHLSVVKKARGGPLLKFNLDDKDINVDGVCFDKVLNFTTVTGEEMIFNKDGKEYEVKDSVHALLTTLENDAVDLKTQLAKASANVDALNDEISVLKAAQVTDSEKTAFAEAVSSRVKLEKEAGALLGAEVSLDGLTDRQIKEKVVSLSTKSSLVDKCDTYVDARYDFALDSINAKTDDTFGDSVVSGTANDSEDVAEVARKKAWNRALNQWKGK